MFGFEPVARTFEMFQANCALNSSEVKAIRAAVGDRDGVADLFFNDDAMIASLGAPDGRQSERVPIRTLKTFLLEQELVDCNA